MQQFPFSEMCDRDALFLEVIAKRFDKSPTAEAVTAATSVAAATKSNMR